MTPLPSAIGIQAAALLAPEGEVCPNACDMRVALSPEQASQQDLTPAGDGACTPSPAVQSDHAQIAARIRAAMTEHDRVCGCRQFVAAAPERAS